MEKTMKIQKVLPIQDRQYNGQQGQQRVCENRLYISTIKKV